VTLSKPENKSLTFVSRHPPYGNDHAFACLDLVLASSVFEQDVNYLFMGDGVFQLLIDQQPDGIGSKNLVASLAALELYGVSNVFVDALSLQKRKLSVSDLAIQIKVLDAVQVETLVNEADLVFNL